VTPKYWSWRDQPAENSFTAVPVGAETNIRRNKESWREVPCIREQASSRIGVRLMLHDLNQVSTGLLRHASRSAAKLGGYQAAGDQPVSNSFIDEERQNTQ